MERVNPEKDILTAARERFALLEDEPCWNAKVGYGACLTLQFRQPHLEIREPRTPIGVVSDRLRESFARRIVRVHGAWRLWIYCCDWLVYQNGQLVGESTAKKRANRAAAELDGQKLVTVNLEPENQQWTFGFDLGGSLETVPYSELSSSGEPYEQWLLFEPDGYVLVARADGAYKREPGDTLPAQERWVLPRQ